ncbi:dienelactone hydrolase family protein [Effusibacillus dendaii]|uniref:Carboxymethylenebutenolidase n=1 Tax=Effusibacillus dendaii TaxID=2743772 RepID=A0A7I8DAW1_9BACL|nr:dienelactone hydrolase family protein [Effusibacillus dendaii]BCJ87234.1 carboxymethylenebutenolidase [Effusibacillus dendaii]
MLRYHDRKEGGVKINLHTEWVSYGTDREFMGYLAQPKQVNGQLPAVLVFQEIWGVDAHIQDVTNRIANAGYLAFAPDLYARYGKRPGNMTDERIAEVLQFLESVPPTVWNDPAQREEELAKRPEDSKTRISETFAAMFSQLSPDNYTKQLIATTDFLRNQHEITKEQGIASMGFCMGGAMSAYLATQDPQLRGAIIFYGTAPKQELIQNINCPVLGLYGELDARITDAVPGFAEQMKAAGKSFEYKIYPKAHHAFFNDTRASYQVEAARDAFVQTLNFLQKVLV